MPTTTPVPVKIKLTREETTIARYALLIVAAIADLVLLVVSVTSSLPPSVAAKWGGVITAAGLLGHAGLEGVKWASGTLHVDDPTSLLQPAADQLQKTAGTIIDQVTAAVDEHLGVVLPTTTAKLIADVNAATVLAPQAAADAPVDLTNVEQLVSDVAEVSKQPEATATSITGLGAGNTALIPTGTPDEPVPVPAAKPDPVDLNQDKVTTSVPAPVAPQTSGSGSTTVAPGATATTQAPSAWQPATVAPDQPVQAPPVPPPASPPAAGSVTP